MNMYCHVNITSFLVVFFLANKILIYPNLVILYNELVENDSGIQFHVQIIGLGFQLDWS